MEQNGDRSMLNVRFLLKKAIVLRPYKKSICKKNEIIDQRVDFYVLKKPTKLKRNRFSSFGIIFVNDLKKVVLRKIRLKVQLEFSPREKKFFELTLNHLFHAHTVTLLQKFPIPRMQLVVACKAIFLRGYSLLHACLLTKFGLRQFFRICACIMA